ncbi:hypothetical protein TSMEX_001958 [Taenia solium]|eukprot:TsM_000887700 transcript=TsM_000887700 gene=TsM_000887700
MERFSLLEELANTAEILALTGDRNMEESEANVDVSASDGVAADLRQQLMGTKFENGKCQSSVRVESADIRREGLVKFFLCPNPIIPILTLTQALLATIGRSKPTPGSNKNKLRAMTTWFELVEDYDYDYDESVVGCG